MGAHRNLDGWTAQCGVVFSTRRKWWAHRAHCVECKSVASKKKMDGFYSWRKNHPDQAKLHDLKCRNLLHDWENNNQELLADYQRHNMDRLNQWKSDHKEEWLEKYNNRGPKLRLWHLNHPELSEKYAERAASGLSKWRASFPEEYEKAQEAAKLATIEWQRKNPDQFLVNIKKMQKTAKPSKMELGLRQERVLTWSDGHIQCLNTIKQVDFVSPDQKIWIEVDGCFHFKEVSINKPRLSRIQSRDAILNQEALFRKDVTLIRLSGSCFKLRGSIKSEWRTWLLKMIEFPKPGVWCCGTWYRFVPWMISEYTFVESPN